MSAIAMRNLTAFPHGLKSGDIGMNAATIRILTTLPNARHRQPYHHPPQPTGYLHARSFHGTPSPQSEGTTITTILPKKPYSPPLNKTPFARDHAHQEAKMVPFAGYSMPLIYRHQSHTESHVWTRTHASVFDVSHMLQQTFSGPNAALFLESITPTDVRSMAIGTTTLSAIMCDDDSGGMLDDCVIGRLSEDKFHVVSNGARAQVIDSYFTRKLVSNDEIWGVIGVDRQVIRLGGILAVQGPEAASIVSKVVFLPEQLTNWPSSSTEDPYSTFYFGSITEGRIQDPYPYHPPHNTHTYQTPYPLSPPPPRTPVLLSRTGYTGEDGFEIAFSARTPYDLSRIASKLTQSLFHASTDPETKTTKLRWAGLAARDSLRLEAGMCLYGHDIDTSTTPPEAGLGWIIPKSRRTSPPTKSYPQPGSPGEKQVLPPLSSYPGQATITTQLLTKNIPTRRIGLKIAPGRPAREGDEIHLVGEDSKPVGKVTSGLPSPTTGLNIAMGYVPSGHHKPGTKLVVVSQRGGKTMEAEVVKLPFVEVKYYRAPKAE